MLWFTAGLGASAVAGVCATGGRGAAGGAATADWAALKPIIKDLITVLEGTKTWPPASARPDESIDAERRVVEYLRAGGRVECEQALVFRGYAHKATRDDGRAEVDNRRPRANPAPRIPRRMRRTIAPRC